MRRLAICASACLLLAGCAGAPAVSVSSLPTPEAQRATAAPTTTETTTPTASPSASAREVALDIERPPLLEHLEQLQRIADDREGNRATGTAAFAESVRYVSARLSEAGYRVEHQVFEVEGTTTTNLLAEWRGTTDGVLILGAHLDSVAAGPGINDNGSGVAALLVLADAIRDLSAPTLTVRFAFWGAEEGGPFGSQAYVDELSPDERSRIRAYLNFDMLASPNAVRLVYAEANAAPGSEALTDVLAAHFEDAGLPWEPIDLEGDSDHGPFIDAGIATGGLFSGGIEPVTDAQAATFGATAGVPADPCSHMACDTIDNVELATLEEMTHAIAHALVSLAYGEP